MKILLLFLLSSFTVCGQFIKNYHPLINKAELAIVDSNYREALTLYRTAFAAVKNPRGRDYENAARCAFLIFDESSGKFFLRKMASYGYSEEYLKDDVQHVLFRPSFDDVTFSEEMRSRYEGFVEKQNEEISKTPRISELFEKFNQKRQLEASKEDASTLSTLNREFADLMDEKKKNSLSFADKFESHLLVNLLRDKTVEFDAKNLQSKLVTAIDSGYLSPDDAYNILAVRQYDFLRHSARLLLRIAVNPYVCDDKESVEPKVDKWLTDKELIASKTGNKIDEIRKKIGHESLADELKKRIHSMKCDDECNFDLRCPKQHTSYPPSCELTKELLVGMEVF